MKYMALTGAAIGLLLLAADSVNAANVSVVFAEGISVIEQDRALVQAGAKRVHRIRSIRVVEAIVPSAASRQALSGNASVSSVEDVIAMQAITTDGPGSGGHVGSSGTTAEGDIIPTGVDRVDGEASSFSGDGVTVAVLDTGIDSDHPDLIANLLPASINTITTGDAEDDEGHGTHVAGTIAAALNGTGVVGVAPGAKLLAVKVLNANGSGTDVSVANGITWAADNGANVINMSLSGGSTTTLRNAAIYADAKGVVIVCAAGNDGRPKGRRNTSTVGYPAAYTECIAVSAWSDTDGTSTDVDGDGGTDEVIANFSSRGPEVEIAGPGVGILSTYIGGGLATGDGTSMASPHVAGVAALLIEEAGAGWSAADIRGALSSTAEALDGKATDVGAGLAHAPGTPGGSEPPPDPDPEPEPNPITSLTVATTVTNGSVFNNRDRVLIDVAVTDQDGLPVAGASVSSTIASASGNTLGGSATSGSDGVAHFSYKVNSKRDGTGTYTVSGDASLGALSASDETTFEVQ